MKIFSLSLAGILLSISVAQGAAQVVSSSSTVTESTYVVRGFVGNELKEIQEMLEKQKEFLTEKNGPLVEVLADEVLVELILQQARSLDQRRDTARQLIREVTRLVALLGSNPPQIKQLMNIIIGCEDLAGIFNFSAFIFFLEQASSNNGKSAVVIRPLLEMCKLLLRGAGIFGKTHDFWSPVFGDTIARAFCERLGVVKRIEKLLGGLNGVTKSNADRLRDAFLVNIDGTSFQNLLQRAKKILEDNITSNISSEHIECLKDFIAYGNAIEATLLNNGYSLGGLFPMSGAMHTAVSCLCSELSEARYQSMMHVRECFDNVVRSYNKGSTPEAYWFTGNQNMPVGLAGYFAVCEEWLDGKRRTLNERTEQEKKEIQRFVVICKLLEARFPGKMRQGVAAVQSQNSDPLTQAQHGLGRMLEGIKELRKLAAASDDELKGQLDVVTSTTSVQPTLHELYSPDPKIAVQLKDRINYLSSLPHTAQPKVESKQVVAGAGRGKSGVVGSMSSSSKTSSNLRAKHRKDALFPMRHAMHAAVSSLCSDILRLEEKDESMQLLRERFNDAVRSFYNDNYASQPSWFIGSPNAQQGLAQCFEACKEWLRGKASSSREYTEQEILNIKRFVSRCARLGEKFPAINVPRWITSTFRITSNGNIARARRRARVNVSAQDKLMLQSALLQSDAMYMREGIADSGAPTE